MQYAGEPGYPEKVRQIQSNFLKKGEGRGGSSTLFDLGFIDPNTGQKVELNKSIYNVDSPRKMTGSLVPLRRENITTVRVRTKNNSYIYG